MLDVYAIYLHPDPRCHGQRIDRHTRKTAQRIVIIFLVHPACLVCHWIRHIGSRHLTDYSSLGDKESDSYGEFKRCLHLGLEETTQYFLRSKRRSMENLS